MQRRPLGNIALRTWLGLAVLYFDSFVCSNAADRKLTATMLIAGIGPDSMVQLAIFLLFPILAHLKLISCISTGCVPSLSIPAVQFKVVHSGQGLGLGQGLGQGLGHQIRSRLLSPHSCDISRTSLILARMCILWLGFQACPTGVGELGAAYTS